MVSSRARAEVGEKKGKMKAPVVITSNSGWCQCRSIKITAEQEVTKLEAEPQRHAADGGEAEELNYWHPPEKKRKKTTT